LVQCDLVTLKQVRVLSRPEWRGSKFCFRVYSDKAGISTIYIGAYRRQRLADQVNKLYDKFVDLEVNRVPWLVRRKAASGTMFYLMEIKES
jgi:hypothetical protein